MANATAVVPAAVKSLVSPPNRHFNNVFVPLLELMFLGFSLIAFFLLAVCLRCCWWLRSSRANQGWAIHRIRHPRRVPVWGVDVPPPVPHGPAPRPNVSWRISAHLRASYNTILLPTVPKLGWTVGDLAIGVIYLASFAVANVLFKECVRTESAALTCQTPMTNVPIVVILGTKRSLATALTGKSYLQLNFLHRMMGRAIWVSLTIHAVFFMFVDKQTQRGDIMRPFGIISYFALCLPVVVGIGKIRRRFYQLFYWSHQIGIAVFLGFGVAHVPMPFLPYIIASGVALGIDYGMRVLTGRIRYATLSRQRGNVTHVHIEGLDDGWRPGQHIFIRFLHGRLAFESHPISIGNAPSSILPGRGLTLVIAGVGGWSKRVRALAQRPTQEVICDPMAEDYSRTVRVLVTGPLGGLTYRDAGRCEAVMITAGGSGISFALAMLEDLVGSALHGGHRARTRARLIAVVWSVRDRAMITTFAGRLEHLLELAQGVVFLSIQVHATGPAPSAEHKPPKSPWSADFPTIDDWPSSGKSAKSMSKSVKSMSSSPTSNHRLEKMMPLAHINEGRPDIAKMLDALVDSLIGPKEAWRGGICVVACGPMPMVFSARKAVSSISRSKSVQAGGIVMHSEAFAG